MEEQFHQLVWYVATGNVTKMDSLLSSVPDKDTLLCQRTARGKTLIQVLEKSRISQDLKVEVRKRLGSENEKALLERLEKGVNEVHKMALKGDLQGMHKAIECGVDLNIQSRVGMTALHYALLRNDKAMVSLLIQAKINPFIRASTQPILHWIMRRCPSMFKVFVEQVSSLYGNDSAWIDAPDQNGWTALHVAVARGLKDKVVMLLDLGASQDTQNNKLQTPLCLALGMRRGFIVGILDPTGARSTPKSDMQNLRRMMEESAKLNDALDVLSIKGDREFRWARDKALSGKRKKSSRSPERGPKKDRMALRSEIKWAAKDAVF